MRKMIPALVGIVVISVLGGMWVYNRRPLLPGSTQNPPTHNEQRKPDVGTDVCAEFPASFVEEVIGKKILKTDAFNSTITHTCKYYTTEKGSFLSIHVENLNFERQRKGLHLLDRPTREDTSIAMEHFVSWQGENVYGVYLKLGPDRFISISRSTLVAATNEENIQLARAVVSRIQKGENIAVSASPTSPPAQTVNAVRNDSKDTIVSFFDRIDKAKVKEAVSYLSKDAAGNEEQKKAWEQQFGAITSVTIDSIQEYMKEEWSANARQYKVSLTVTLDPRSANAPLPYYGWESGKNIRWITVVTSGSEWKVDTIATGP